MDNSIIYEDDEVLVLNKPAGVVVNRSETVGEETVQDWAEKYYRLKGYQVNSLERSGLVHRLDKETSGCLIIAKAPAAFTKLQRQFKAREVQKEYLALVHGEVHPAAGAIRVPLARSRYDRQKIAVTPGGREAETRYEVEKLFHNTEPFTLLRLYPKTGRTHQIRVHLAYFGHSLVADEKYAGEKRSRADRRWCPRLFLHAAKISFVHPTNNETVRVECPLPQDLREVLGQLPVG